MIHRVHYCGTASPNTQHLSIGATNMFCLLLGSLNAQTLVEEVSPAKSMAKKSKQSVVECFQDDNGAMDWDDTDIPASYNQEELRHRLKNAELEAFESQGATETSRSC